MNKFDLTDKIEKFAPLDTQEPWDCSGWLVCTKNNNVNKVMLALTVTDGVVRQARECGCDMIISHHPLFCVPLEYSDLNIYCAHTNMDKAKGGTTDCLISALGFETSEAVDEFVRVVNCSMSTDELTNRLRALSPNLRYVNNSGIKKIHSIGFCAGSGSEFIDSIDVDAFVTGDMKFHTALESKPVVYDIGHFESEIGVLNVFKDILGVDTVLADEHTPFLYL